MKKDFAGLTHIAAQTLKKPKNSLFFVGKSRFSVLG